MSESYFVTVSRYLQTLTFVKKNQNRNNKETKFGIFLPGVKTPLLLVTASWI